jgi:hypothetical protein
VHDWHWSRQIDAAAVQAHAAAGLLVSCWVGNFQHELRTVVHRLGHVIWQLATTDGVQRGEPFLTADSIFARLWMDLQVEPPTSGKDVDLAISRYLSLCVCCPGCRHVWAVEGSLLWAEGLAQELHHSLSIFPCRKPWPACRVEELLQEEPQPYHPTPGHLAAALRLLRDAEPHYKLVERLSLGAYAEQQDVAGSYMPGRAVCVVTRVCTAVDQ